MNKQQQADLANHAIRKARQAVKDVLVLDDSNQFRASVLTSVALDMIRGAIEMLEDPLTMKEATTIVFEALLDAVTEDIKQKAKP